MDSLEGLPVGDAYGAQHVTRPDLRTPPWPWTDDTQMAAVLLAHLREHVPADQDRLAGQRHLRDFRGAVEACCTAGGDVDTTAAIVGGIVAACDPAVPAEWKAAREPLP